MHEGAAEEFEGVFEPTCARPSGLAWPCRIDPAGRTGPTRWGASTAAWTRVAPGRFVPSDRPLTPEQRIVEGAARLLPEGRNGSVTGWAALRWRGATYFDGRRADGTFDRVGIVASLTGHLRSDARSVVHREHLAGHHCEFVDGLPLVPVQRALFDEIRARASLVPAVQAIDMAAAAGLISVWLFAQYIGECNSRRHAPLAREACAFAVDESASPRETWLRMVWLRGAGLPTPLVNVPVFDPSGNLIGIPDLLDPETGLVGEYNGATHRGRERYLRDVERDDRFRRAGLEPITVVAGDSRQTVVARLLAGRERAARRTREWTLEPPPGYVVGESLDERLGRLGLVETLTRYC